MGFERGAESEVRGALKKTACPASRRISAGFTGCGLLRGGKVSGKMSSISLRYPVKRVLLCGCYGFKSRMVGRM